MSRSARCAGVSGATVLVTGAAQGIGEAVARRMAAEGARLALVDCQAERLASVAAALRDSGATALALAADVQDRTAVAAAVAAAVLELGPIDVLVNAAGVLRPGNILDASEVDWTQTLAVNAGGVFHMSQAVARVMVARNKGVIITVGSNAAGVVRANMAAYAASKAAATMFTKCLGLELARYGIRCNIVSPGSTDTPMQRALWTSPEAPAQVIAGSLDNHRTGIPLGRLATAADIAAAVLFLASDEAAHITMHDLYVDGGATLRA
jgi:2,3-dihydro-2,3-dihydroxybenzoate dehydrogenase